MITDRPEWQQMTAIRNHNVHILEEGLYCRPSPRLLEGLEQLVNILHPSLGTSLDSQISYIFCSTKAIAILIRTF
nr:hypothetical protein [Brevibacillus laterosporus]